MRSSSKSTKIKKKILMGKQTKDVNRQFTEKEIRKLINTGRDI